MIDEVDEAGNGSVQIPSLSRALGRVKVTKDPFAEDGETVASGRMRVRVIAKIRSALLEGNDGTAERVPGTEVPVVRLKRFIDALEKQAQARETKIGRQARRVLTFLRKDMQQGDEADVGVNVAQFRKLLRVVERQTADGAAENVQNDARKVKARRAPRRQSA